MLRLLFIVLAWSFAHAAPACTASDEFEQLMRMLQQHKQARDDYDARLACFSDSERLSRAIRAKSRGDTLSLALRSGTDARRRGDEAAACARFREAQKAAGDDLSDLRAQAARCPRR